MFETLNVSVPNHIFLSPQKDLFLYTFSVLFISPVYHFYRSVYLSVFIIIVLYAFMLYIKDMKDPEIYLVWLWEIHSC